MILCDSNGDFITDVSICFDGLYQVLEVEATGLREALSWINDKGFSHVIFESHA